MYGLSAREFKAKILRRIIRWEVPNINKLRLTKHVRLWLDSNFEKIFTKIFESTKYKKRLIFILDKVKIKSKSKF